MESLTRPPFHHRRKLSTISRSGLSYSGKEGHEDLFLVGNNKTKLRRAVSVEDYGEIFGGGGASVSSIKVLDLSDFDGPNGSGELRNSNVPVDYSRIFGGSAGDDGPVARPVPPYEELFDGAYKSNNDKAKQRVTADKESPLKGSDNVNDSYHGEMPEASNQDFDGAKKLNMSYHKTSPHGKNGSNGTKHVAQLNAVPGFAFFVNGDAGMQKQDIDKAIPRAQHVKAPPIDQSHPKGNLFYSGELDKSGPSKVSPASSSRARLNIDKMHLNQSESSSLGSKVDSPEKGADDGDLPKTTSDEELDVNSAASVSAAALKKAIQEAQESIRIAKEIMEKKQDSMKMHSRCSLKVPNVIETKHVQHITSVSEINMKDACDVVDKDALLVNSKIDSLNQKENVEADGGMSSWFTHMLHNGKNRMAAFASQLVDKKTDSILPENCNQLQDAKTAKPEIETSEKNNPEKANTVDRRDVVSELKTFDTATYFSTNVISVPGMLVKDSNLMTQVDEECLQTRLDQGTTNKNGHEAKDCGHESAAEIIENEDIDVTTEHKEDGFAEGKIVEEDKEISETNALSKYANENHLNGSIDSCDTRDSDDISNGIPSQDFELCGLEVKNSLMDNILAGHEKKACQLEVLKTEANNDLVVEENENENENEVEDEIEEASRLKESEVCETSYYLNRSNEEDNLQGANSEGHRDLECEEDRKQVESELDRSNEERDVLEIIDGKNETNDNLECAVDEKEVEEDDERSYLDQNNVQGDDMETVVEDIFEAPLASDSKTDTIHEEIMLGEQPSDVDQVETSAFIYIGTEEHGIKNDMNDNPPPSEEYPPTFCLIDKNDSDKNVDSLNFVLGPENTIGMVHECSTEEVDTSKREGKKDNHVEDHQEKDWVEENMETKSDMTNIYEEIDSVLKTGQGMECSEENLNRSETVSVEIGEAKQKETDNDNYHKNILAIKREKERQKDKIAVESAMREARERAFVEASERAERVAVDKANAEARQRASESWEKLEKASSQANLSTDKASVEAAKLKVERAAVGRATEEARERALEKAMAQKSGTEARHSGSKNTGMKHSVSSPDLGSLEESNNESAQRRKARLERHERIMERAAKALAEKNMRDILAQREQSERNRIAETLNAEIKRWSSGKEGNLRALLSTLQYILGVNSGWQPITLTEIITTSAVKKAYKKATLYVHPDKLQQKGASIQHKYICEKVFDLLQAARNKFNSEER